MKQRSISEIFFKLPDELNEDERRIQIFLLIPFGLFFNLILSYIWFVILMGLDFIPFFLALSFIIVGIISVLHYWDKLDRKYGMMPVESPYQLSYQGYLILLLLTSPAFFLLMVMLGFTSDNFWFGLGGAVAIVYPILGMFLRIKTFSDDSIIIPKGNVVLPEKVVLPNGNEFTYEKGEVIETVKGFGYMPVAYWIVTVVLGLYTVVRGFSGIHLHFTNGSPSLEAAFFTIVLGLLVQSIYIFPDKLNKIVPIELRSEKGFLFMFIMSFILFGVSQLLIGLVSQKMA